MTHRLGLMGGTFNPIHYGHLSAAEEARQAFHLDQVLFIPSGEPPHKPGADLLPAPIRYLLTLMAVADNPHFSVSRIEIDRKGLTYTRDTLRTLRRSFPRSEFYFITGIDAILEMHTWHKAGNLFDLCEFIAASRPGYRMEKLDEVFSATERKRIHALEIAHLAISSSDIRDRLKHGRSIRYLTPPAVADYLESHRAYRAGATL